MAKPSSVREFCDDVSSRYRSLRDACEDVDDSREKFGLPRQWGPLRPDASEEEIRKYDGYERAFAEWGEEFKKREIKAALAVTTNWGANWQQELKKLYALAIREIGEKGLARYLSKFERLYLAFLSMIEDAESGQCDLQGYGGDCEFVEAFGDFETIALAFDEPSESGAEDDERPPVRQRFTFDDSTHTINFDGEEFPKIDPTAYFMFRAIASRNGVKITREEINQVVRGDVLMGKNAISQRKAFLPPELRKCLESNPKGHWLVCRQSKKETTGNKGT